MKHITQLCEAYPEVVRTFQGAHADFRVRGRVFAYYLDNHHGDGIVSLCCKSELGENVDRANSQPERYYLPAYIGARGWFGVRLDVGPIDWREIGKLLERSYCLVAPKTLARSVCGNER